MEPDSQDGDSLPSEIGSLERYATTPPVNFRERKRSSERKSKLLGGLNSQKMAQLQKRVHRQSTSGLKLDSLDDVSCQLEVGSPETTYHSLGADFPERTQSFSHRKKKNETKNRSFDRDLKRRASDAGSFTNRQSRGEC